MNDIADTVDSINIQLGELLKENTDKNIAKTSMCEECKNWQHKKLWIDYKFCPYCGRVLRRPIVGLRAKLSVFDNYYEIPQEIIDEVCTPFTEKRK